MVAIGEKNICNMAITSIEHQGHYYEVFDARGKKEKLFLTSSENYWGGVTGFSLL